MPTVRYWDGPHRFFLQTGLFPFIIGGLIQRAVLRRSAHKRVRVPQEKVGRMEVPAIIVFIVSCSILLSASLLGAPQEQPDIAQPVALASASPATQPMQSPVLGFVTTSRTALVRGQGRGGEGYSNPSVTVRAILGVPGAAMLSGALTMPRGVAGAYFAPGQSFALVEQSAGSLAVLQFNGTVAGALQAIPGSISRPDIVSFSPNGSAAAVYSTEGRLAIITGLPGSPQLSRDVSANLPAGIQALALADDGATLLAVTSDGRVLLLPAGGGTETIYSGGQLSGLVFAPASTDALVFDSDGNKVLLVQNVSTAPATRLLAQGLSGIPGSALLQFDANTAWIGAVNGKQLSRIDLQTLHADTMTLSAGLAALQPLLVPHRFLLSAQPGQEAWVLDTSNATSANTGTVAGNVYFVPPQLAMRVR